MPVVAQSFSALLEKHGHVRIEVKGGTANLCLSKMEDFVGDHERLQKVVISNLDYSNKSFFRNRSRFYTLDTFQSSIY